MASFRHSGRDEHLTYGAITTHPDRSTSSSAPPRGPSATGLRGRPAQRDGTIDTTFNRAEGVKLVAFVLGGGATSNNDDVATGLIVQPDGRIIIMGTASGFVHHPDQAPPQRRLRPDFRGDGKLNTNANPDRQR